MVCIFGVLTVAKNPQAASGAAQSRPAAPFTVVEATIADMHHGTQSDPSDRPAPGVCGIKACNSPVDVALLSMAGGAGVLSSSLQFDYPLVTAAVVIQEPASLDQPAPNHTPPPRL